MRFSIFTSFVLSVFLAFPIGAQEKDRLDSRGELLGWEGVGLLNLGSGTCTGALIARDVVLTAAHCVVDEVSGKVKALAPMRFHAGYTHGFTVATRKVTKIVVADGYSVDPALPITQKVATDLALLRLDNAIFSTEAEPFKVHKRPLANDRVTLVSYGQGRNDSLQRESGCRHKETYRGGLMTFDCDATFGSSGAPIFTREDGLLRIVSVISMGTGAPGVEKEAIGMSLPAVVAAMKSELNKDASRVSVTNGAKRVTVGQRSTGGARFVKADN